MTPEFSRTVDSRRLPNAPVVMEANAAERAALAERFGVEAIQTLFAQVTLLKVGDVIEASGTIDADLTQACAVSGEPLAVSVSEPIAIRFIPPAPPRVGDEEIELDAEDCDEIEMEGTTLDLGEAVAQTLGLAIDPYATGPEAEVVRREVGLSEEATSGPFAALKGLVGK